MRPRLAVASKSAVRVECAPGEAGLREKIEARVRAIGLRVADEGEPDVSLVVRSRRAAQLASLFGADAPRHCITEDELDRVSVEELASATDAQHPTPFAEIELRIADLSRRSPSTDRTTEAARWLLDPRVIDAASRAALVSIVESASAVIAIETLCAAIALRRSSASTEAVAFGRLVARGARRFELDGPFAIELDDPRDECTPATLASFRDSERYQRLRDERGSTVHRALFAEIPWLDAMSDTLPPALSLLRSLNDSDAARVWIAGATLPASLPWTLWTTILGQRARR